MNGPTPSARADRPPLSPDIEAAAADWVTRVDAGLTKEEQQIFQDWLSGDPRHADSFDRLTEAWSVFDRVQEHGAASVILDQLAVRARRRRTRRAQAAVAASLVLLVALVYAPWRSAAPAAASRLAVTAQVAPSDPVRKLPDGSIVELNAGAEIEVRYSDEARHVKLVKGEAFFRVEKDPARPFFVEAHGVVVRAVGTAFTVQMQSAAIEVVVKEGAVDVGRAPAAGAAAGHPPVDSVRVKAGNSVRIALLRLRQPRPVVAPETPVAPPPALAQPEPLSEKEMEARLAWRIPRIEFEGMALGAAVERMNRHNRLQLRLASDQLADFRLSGTFRTDNPEGFVRMLEQTALARAERHGEDLIVLYPAR